MRTFSPARGTKEPSQLVAISLLSGSTYVTGTGSRNRLDTATRLPAVSLGLSEQGVHEGLGLERREVVRPLAETDQLHRHPELALHRNDDAALRGAVELGQHDARDVDHLAEHACLHQS